MAVLQPYNPDGKKIIHTTGIDFNARPSIFKPVHIVQYDVTIPIIAVELYNNGNEYAAPSGASANIRFRKKGGTVVYNPALGCSSDRKIIYFEVTRQMVADYGDFKPIVEMKIGENVAGSSAITVIVDKNPIQDGDIESSDEYTALNEYVEAAQNSADAAAASQAAAKTSENNAKNSASQAATSASNAASSATSANASKEAAATSASEASASKDAAAKSATAAAASQTAAKTSETNASKSAAAAKTSETNASNSADAAAASQTAAKTSENNAKASQTAAAKSATAAASSESRAFDSKESAAESATVAAMSAEEAKNSEAAVAASAAAAAESATDSANSATQASASETNAKKSADAAAASQAAAKTSENNAKASQTAAAASQTAAKTSETNAENWSNWSKSYAIGEGGMRNNEASDNAKYYCDQAKRIAQGFEGSLIPMGTIPFSSLSTTSKQVGYMYNISNAFTSDNTFEDGGGHLYGAGSNVYYTANNKWDVLAAITVTGVKGNAESSYHQGNIEIGPEDLKLASNFAAAASRTQIAANDSIPTAFSKAAKYFADLKDIAFTGSVVTGAKGNAESSYHTGKVEIGPEDIKLPTTFAAATARAGVAANDTLDVAFSKLAKYCSDLKTVAFTGKYSDLSGIPSIPTTLKNPYSLTFTGGSNVVYDGSSAKSVAVQSPTGDTANNIIAYTSGDVLDPTSWATVSQLTTNEKHSSLLNKISTMIRNVRYIWKILGNSDISKLGSGTVTSALLGLESNKVNKTDIVNNLLSTSTDKPLSAAMGKHLNEAINANTNNKCTMGGLYTIGVNIDTIVPGIYWINSYNPGTGTFPWTNSHFILIGQGDKNGCMNQIAILTYNPSITSTQIKSRYRGPDTAGTWEPWK